jgi:hypothetical protein
MFTVVLFPAAGYYHHNHLRVNIRTLPRPSTPSRTFPMPYLAVHNYSQIIFMKVCEGFVHKYILFSIGKVWLRVK